eukprot:XP_011675152.1 PREDICTED: sushi repeat-containing protein SRPX2-like [Strongylocentrotus purpuratus]
MLFKNRRTAGAAPGSQFSEGSNTITYRAVDTSGNARTCSFSFTVVVIRCGTISPPTNGIVSCTNGRSVGSVCQSSCNTGYLLSGSASRTCVRSGNSASWSGSTASCTRITCSPTLTSPPNCLISCTDTSFFASVCTYTCHPGYTLTSGSSQRTCTSSGWSGITAHCQDAWRRRRRSPPPPPPPDVDAWRRRRRRSPPPDNFDIFPSLIDTTPPTLNGCPSSLGNQYTTTSTARVTWTKPTCSDSRSSCSVTRTAGAAPGSQFSEGSHTITYRAVDTSVLRCGTLSRPTNGIVSCTNGRSVGSVCQSSCNTGYLLSGSTSTTCGRSGNSGSWSGSTVSCTRITCSPTLTSPPNCLISCTDSSFFASVCTYTCHTGYTRTSGSSQRTCTSSGWSGTTANCQDVTPPTFVECPASQTVYAEDLKTSAVVRWTEPRVSDTTGQTITSTRTLGPASGSTFLGGITSIAYDAVDGAGNKALTCTYTITVEGRLVYP